MKFFLICLAIAVVLFIIGLISFKATKAKNKKINAAKKEGADSAELKKKGSFGFAIVMFILGILSLVIGAVVMWR